MSAPAKASIVKTITNIYKPINDTRNYEYVVLSNKLEALLISDPTTEKSSAALDVRIGNFLDPKEIQGLAHFLEHMLFLNTKKYPVESEYKAFIKRNGGYSNASTSMESTNYYFDVTSDSFEEALDRFSSFFVEPLFSEDGVSREMKAVHSEHSKNIQTDSRRFYQLMRNYSNADHPFCKFGTGNLETLEEGPKKMNINVKDELLKFYDKYYSANLMKVCILAREPLEKIREWVVEKFGPIQNKDVVLPASFRELPAISKEKQIGKLFRVIPVKDIRDLTILFPVVPYKTFEHAYLKKPLKYYSHLMGHEGPGSILSVLKKKGWGNGLFAGTCYNFTEQAVFGVYVELTEEGENHVDEIISIVFEYIQLLKKEGVKKWIWEEAKNISESKFKFREKSNPVDVCHNTAADMQKVPPEHVLCGTSLPVEYDEACITEFLNYFSPANMLMFMMSKKNAQLIPEAELQKEKWYHAQYQVTDIDKGLLTQLSMEPIHKHEDLHLPHPNEFVSTNFDIKPMEPEQEAAKPNPVLYKSNQFLNLWFKQEDVFKTPKAILTMQITIPSTYASPLNFIYNKLFSELIDDLLNEYSYAASLANYHFELSSLRYGLLLELSGFNEKIFTLFSKVFEKITQAANNPESVFNQERFALIKERLKRKYKNSFKEQPYDYSDQRALKILYSTKYDFEDYLQIIDKVEMSRFIQFVKFWLSSCSIVCFAHGNLNNQDMDWLFNHITTSLEKNSTIPMLECQEFKETIVKLSEDTSPTRKPLDYIHMAPLPNEEDQNCCLEVYYEVGLCTMPTKILLKLFSQIVHAPYYSTIRTKEQLGYIVFSRMYQVHNVLYYVITIQSPEKRPEYLLQRNDMFFAKLEKLLGEVTNEELEEHKRALKKILLEKDKNIRQVHGRYLREIQSRQFNFERSAQEAVQAEKITKEDLVNFYNTYIKNGTRLVVQILSKKHTRESNHTESQTTTTAQDEHETQPATTAVAVQVTDIEAFKKEKALYPAFAKY